MFFGDPAIAGKYYYGEGLKGFNFERRMMSFREALQAIVAAVEAPGGKSVYAGSAPCRECLPGFAPDNAMPLLAPETAPRIWLGTASNVSSHYDTFDNLACVIAGRRRFTLYAPELIGRLYVGPIDHTMAGPPVSLAASSPPDDERFPLFREVRDQAFVCELEAGRCAVPAEAVVAPGRIDSPHSTGWSTTGGTRSPRVPMRPIPACCSP